MSDTVSDSRQHVARARRYRLQLGVECRAGAYDWRTGQTRDVSASGVLFEIGSEELTELSVNAPIEITLMLPAGGDVAMSRVVCSGRVARIVADQPGGRAHVAATIDRHRLERVDPIEA